jgi:UDP-N-acetylmuramoyl-L-alanyl-D-glutamate--2,6-diaminopimelate ligase
MYLNSLIQGIDFLRYGTGNPDIVGITQDSRLVKPGGMFVAVKGFQQDGHIYIAKAIEKGALAVVVEQLPEAVDNWMDSGVVFLKTKDVRRDLSILARSFYNKPDLALQVIGITGTNGKTSLTYILESLLNAGSKSCGVVGTISIRYGAHTQPASGTTPEALDLMKHFRDMCQLGIEHVAVEVSSHALALQRVHDVSFEVGIFTNLTQDHLDFHETMEAYFGAKKQLFYQVRGLSFINIDDAYGLELYQSLKNEHHAVMGYGFSHLADIRLSDFEMNSQGSHFTLNTTEGSRRYTVGIPGRFNAYNFAVAIAAAQYFGVSEETLQQVLPLVRVPGRLERVDLLRGPELYVDFAHTPDALIKVLTAVREFTTGSLICVFGCGGDRDKSKRPLMGEFAEKAADVVIVTSDNPRTENPHDIMSDILKGMNHPNRAISLLDRRQAIERALQIAKSGDCIVIAGKGHEDYQIIGTEKFHFDDRLVAIEIARNNNDK